MRELLTAQETTKILGLRTTTQLYKIVDFFDSDPEDEWDLVEGEHFEFAGTSGGEKKRKFYEEGVEAIAEYLDKDCLLYTSPSPRDGLLSRMPSSA